jgi:hypothetical protein
MKTIFLASLATLGLSACATLLPPSNAELAALPVVRYGDKAPSGQAFVLHYPASTNLPVEAKVGGSLLEKTDQATLQVKLKQDIYVYKHWLSLDGKNWQASDQLVGGHFKVELPGDQDGHSPGQLSAEFNRK